MAIIRKSALNDLSIEQMREKIIEFESEVQAEHIAKTTAGKSSNPGRARTLRKTIARIKTLLSKRGAKETKAKVAPLKESGRNKTAKKQSKTPVKKA